MLYRVCELRYNSHTFVPRVQRDTDVYTSANLTRSRVGIIRDRTRELAERIYDSLGDPETEVDEDGWSEELKRRVDNAKSGKAEAISWDEVMKMFHDERDAEAS